MATNEDGGPAFPCPVGHIKCAHPEGLSLRDYFAAKVLAAQMAWDSDQFGPIEPSHDPMAAVRRARCENAYRYADAMLKARSQP